MKIPEENKDETIKQKIAALEFELKELKSQLSKKSTVNSAPAFENIFNEAQKTVKDYFTNLDFQPEKGTIEIDNERYILVRASSLSVDFFKNIQDLYTEKTEIEAFNIASNFLFDIGHLIGIQDAKVFHEKMKLLDPISKLAAGPVHFAYSGWAFVDILKESNPSADEHFFLKYNHPYSFEADSWIKSGKKSKEAVCSMNAAYSSGWCSESFGIPLTAVEITCRAKGDESCTFIMAHPNKIEHYLEKELKTHKIKQKLIIPFFFERKKIEQRIQKNEQMLVTAQKISKIGSWEFDLTNNNLEWSIELYNIFGIDAEIERQNLYPIYLSKLYKEDIEILEKNLDRAIKEGKEYSIIHRIKYDSNKIKWIFGSGVPIKNEDGNVTKIIGYAQDITERKNTEQELNQFFRLSNDLLCLADENGFLLKLSLGWRRVLGYTNEELCAVPFIDFVIPDDKERTIEELTRVINGGITNGFENRYRCKDGSYKILNWNASPDKANGHIYCIVRDLTKEREAEQKLISTLNDKEILLKEVHHRVKNNLQIISSLLNLQTNYIENQEFKILYKESQNRIKSIASVHELLYQSNDIGKIDFNSYLRKLISDLLYSYNGDENLVKFKVDTALKFNIDTSIPLGLLLNEMISNSLKHGLKNKKSDKIEISITEISDSKFELNVIDNGIGFDFESTIKRNDSLGLMLITELSSQLNGEIEKLNTQHGTHYRLYFSEN
jgi:PAS domain S-box-containing protein